MLTEDEKDNILMQLKHNDLAIIRAMTENDIVRIEEHKRKQAALRERLARG